VNALDGPQESLMRTELNPASIRSKISPDATLETDRAALSEAAQEPYVRAAERAALPARRRALAGHEMKSFRLTKNY